MEQSKKISRKVISIVLSLMMVFSCFSGMSLTAFAAEEPTVTWDAATENIQIGEDNNQLNPYDASYTKDAITVSATSEEGHTYIDGTRFSEAFMGALSGFVFTNSVANFSKIKLVFTDLSIAGYNKFLDSEYNDDPHWSSDLDSKTVTWEGDSNNVGLYAYDVSGTLDRIEFTYEEPAPSAYAGYVPAEADDADALAAKVVKFNGMDWYLIEDNSTSETEGTVTLFAKDTISSSRFDNSSNVYSGSMVKSYLDNLTAEGGAFADVADAIVSTALEDVNVTGAKLWLLSKDEVITTYKLSTALNKCSNDWWLRTPATSSYLIYVNGESGSVVNSGNFHMNTYGVRPALNLDLSKVEFNSETKTFALPQPLVEYSLWVGGVKVTNKNASNIDGNNKASYDAETNTLTLNGYTNSGTARADIYSGMNNAAIYYNDNMSSPNPLTIQLAEGTTNSLTMTGDRVYGIYVFGSALTITGNGTLNVQSDDMAINDAWGVAITGGTVNAASSAYYGIGRVTIGADISSVTITGKLGAIYGGSNEEQELINAVAGTGWTDVAGTTGQAAIAISTTGQNVSNYKKVYFTPHTHDDITFTAWTSTNSLPTDGGNYYLTNDVKLENTWYAPNSAINLCLDGHSITAAEGKEIQLMDVENGATLNLYDKEDNSGSISGAVSENGAILVNSGTFNMYGGTIKDNMTTDHGAGVRVKFGGTFSLYGGSIENNKTKNQGGNGGGVHVETNSTFNMSGGSIKNNTAFSSAGVFIGTNCTFNMSGGSITGNIATNGYGGVLFTDDGTATFKLSGDVTISDNVTKIDIEEINVHETHPSNMVIPDSVTIEVVDALTGEGKIYVQIGTSRVFTNSTGSVKAKDYIDKFVSDSRMYRIKTEVDELKIEAPHLRVGGTYVYDDNAADVFGDGKVKFTPANETTTYATLTLNGYQYDGTGDENSEGIIYLDAAQLRIVLNSENVVKATNPGIMINREADTIISSENGGSLEVVSKQGDAIYANGALTVESGTISATGANRGIAANGINLNGGKIVAKGTGERGYGIYCESLPWLPATSVSINSGISSLIASGTLGAVYGNVANALEGLGWSNITGTDGQETIAVAAEARSLEYKKVAFVSHTHSFTYSASGATITATCANADGGCMLTDNKATLTIAAPDNLTYDKSAKAAVITDANGIQGAAKVQYQTKSGSTYGEATETAPTNAGTYKASITVGGATASVEYTIAKADPTCTAPTGLTATYGDKLADVTLPDGWAWVDDKTSVGNAGTKTFKANFTPTDTTNYNVVENVDVTVKVNKAANPATVAETAEVVKGGNTVDLSKNVTLNGATGTVTYEIAGEANGCTLDGSVLTSGSGTTTVTVNVNVAADDNYNALETKQITVTVDNKLYQNITVENVTAKYGETGKSVSATTDGDGAITYAVKNGEDCIDIDENTGAITIKKVGTALVVVYAAETDTYNEDSAKVLVTINKGDIAPTVSLDGWTYGDEANKPSIDGNTGKGVVTYLYKEKGASDMSCIEEAPTQAGEYTVKAIIDETDNYNAGSATADFTIAKAKVTITADDKAIMREAALKELTYKVDGKVADGDDLGIKVTSNVKAAVAGKYDIKVAYTENANYDVKVVNGTYTVIDRITKSERIAGNNKINSAIKATVNEDGSITADWGAVANAEKFVVYAGYCSGKYKKIKTVKGNVHSFNITKLNGKKLNLKKSVKIYVVAYRKVNGKYKKITKSITMHVVGKQNKKYSNAKAIKVKKSSYTLKVNKSATIKPTLVLEKKNKKAVKHAAKFRYQSTNKAVATVDKNGKIKAVGKGTCTIYIFANNGKLKSVKVTVK